MFYSNMWMEREPHLSRRQRFHACREFMEISHDILTIVYFFETRKMKRDGVYCSVRFKNNKLGYHIGQSIARTIYNNGIGTYYRYLGDGIKIFSIARTAGTMSSDNTHAKRIYDIIDYTITFENFIIPSRSWLTLS